MANQESIVLRLTPREADSVAYVLMTSLHTVSMLDRERTDATEAANALFKQLKYGHGCDKQGGRVEWNEDASPVKVWPDRKEEESSESDPQGKDSPDDRYVKRLMGIPQYGEE